MNNIITHTLGHSRPKTTIIFTDELDMSLATISKRIIAIGKNYTFNGINESGANKYLWIKDDNNQ